MQCTSACASRAKAPSLGIEPSRVAFGVLAVALTVPGKIESLGVEPSAPSSQSWCRTPRLALVSCPASDRTKTLAVQSRACCQLHHRAVEWKRRESNPLGASCKEGPMPASRPRSRPGRNCTDVLPVISGTLELSQLRASKVIDGSCPRAPAFTARCSVSLSYDHSAKGEICTLMPKRWLLRPVCLLFHHPRKTEPASFDLAASPVTGARSPD
jgi:hypothetical protein